MSTKTVSQLDAAGHFVATTVADESPLEPGVWLMPAGTVEALPPHDVNQAGEFVLVVPEGKWPRWNGAGFDMVTPSKPDEPARGDDPVAKLQAFLAANPDVAAIINKGQPSNV